MTKKKTVPVMVDATHIRQALADAMERAREQTGGLERMLRELRLAALETDASTRKLAQLLREEQQ